MVVAGPGVCCFTASSTALEIPSSCSPAVHRRHHARSNSNISCLSPLHFLLIIFLALLFFVDGATSTMVAMTQTARSVSEVAAVPDRVRSLPLRFQTGLEDNRVDDDEPPAEYGVDVEDNYDDGYDDQEDVGDRLQQQQQQQHHTSNSIVSDSRIKGDTADYDKRIVDVGSIEIPRNNSGRTTTTVTAAGVEVERISRLPQAIIIGVKKGGTRALLEFLRVHPDVRAPGPEVHFFDRNYHRGLDWYRSQMPTTVPGQVTVEKTPSYFVTKAAPSRVYNMSRDVRLIVVVRDPVTRAVSDYAQAVTKRPDMPSFDRMAFLDGGGGSGNRSSGDGDARASGPVATSWGAVKIGVYSRHLERWLRFFPRRQIHFVHGERLVADPAGELADLQDFLGLRRYVTERHFYFNATKGFPCLRKTDVDDADSDRDDGTEDGAGGSASGKGEAGGQSGVRCLGKNKGRTHPVVDAKVLQRLRDFFRPFNEKFYHQTGIDFGWP